MPNYRNMINREAKEDNLAADNEAKKTRVDWLERDPMGKFRDNILPFSGT
jgi:hypothetical protein